ncbi:gamma-glutamylcyclotransferase [Saccharopolyspora taberi]|uniref:Gamma-glutamylcyclotransferase n=1 Tax=Saccharopolyspora taberi TaxID=60895 RepID=A0ABN3V9N4_9PSEU
MVDFSDEDFPADPYPGSRPDGSFVHIGKSGHHLVNGRTLPDGTGLDEFLSAHGAAPLAGRLPVLAYGSNANPSKISWLRDRLGLRGPVVVIGAECHGVSAVWSAGVRARDGQRPAVLAGLPGVVEHHAVWLTTPDQRAVLDECEGRGERYRLSWVHAPVRLEGHGALSSVLAYTARPEAVGADVPVHLNRSPLVVDGHFVRCSEVGQADAVLLVGVAGGEDGLVVSEVSGEP